MKSNEEKICEQNDLMIEYKMCFSVEKYRNGIQKKNEKLCWYFVLLSALFPTKTFVSTVRFFVQFARTRILFFYRRRRRRRP